MIDLASERMAVPEKILRGRQVIIMMDDRNDPDIAAVASQAQRNIAALKADRAKELEM